VQPRDRHDRPSPPKRRERDLHHQRRRQLHRLGRRVGLSQGHWAAGSTCPLPFLSSRRCGALGNTSRARSPCLDLKGGASSRTPAGPSSSVSSWSSSTSASLGELNGPAGPDRRNQSRRALRTSEEI